MNEREAYEGSPGKLVAALGFAVLLIAVVLIGGCSGVRAWNRWQDRNEAKNAVTVTHIRIQQAAQQARINRAQIAATQAEAQKRFVEAVGIRRSQDEISRTLTPLYIQHEAIRAQEDIARSGRNNTAIYIPSGPSGVPSPVMQVPPRK